MSGDRSPTAVDVPTGDAPEAAAGLRTLRLQPSPPESPDGPLTLVLDTTWLPAPDDRAIAAIHAARQVLSETDVIAEASDLLDAWATESGVIPLLALDGTSLWFYDRLVHAKWLQDTVLWLRMVARAVDERGIQAIECAPGVARPVVEAARLVAAARGLPFEAPEPAPPPPPPVRPAPPPKRPAARRRKPSRWGRPIRALSRRLTAAWESLRPDEETRRERRIERWLDRLGREREPRLLVLLQHARQRIDLPDGPRWMNAYLGPIVERIRGTRLEPIELDLRLSYEDDGPWSGRRDTRSLPKDVIAAHADPADGPLATAATARVAAAVARIEVPVLVDGVDLGPLLVTRVGEQVRRSHQRQAVSVRRIRRLLRRLHPAGILLAVEYNRPEWLAAAHDEGIPVAAVQHGLIHRRHGGYDFRSRPDELTLPDRLYVFGSWERDVLIEGGAYRDEQVVVSGSPRLDLVPPGHAEAGRIRAELGIAPEERMVVVSGTWGANYREFYLPIALAALVDRPLPGVHVVIKLHPGEPDEGPYRAVIERAAAAGGFAPPPVTVVQAIDLYRLLDAADAHFGIHSTVLTEAVAVGTLNLIAGMFKGYDLLDYVGAGVAVPVSNGADLLTALDRRAELLPAAAARSAFLEAHFRSGGASQRIADDLLAWLAPNGRTG